MQDMDRAHEYATKVDEPAVWTELAHAQLDHNVVADAIASYLRSWRRLQVRLRCGMQCCPCAELLLHLEHGQQLVPCRLSVWLACTLLGQSRMYYAAWWHLHRRTLLNLGR